MENIYNTWENYCSDILKNNKINDFKKSTNIEHMTEHECLPKFAEDWKEFIIKEAFYNNISLNEINNLIDSNEKLGNSNKNIDWKYFSKCNANTIEYIYITFIVINDLKNKKLSEINFLEIGGGYGGFALIFYKLASLLNIKINNYVMIDLEPVVKLQELYLKNNLNNIDDFIFYNSKDKIKLDKKYYLFSSYSFAEIDKESRKNYYDMLFPNVEYGLIFWNYPEIDIDKYIFNITVEAEVPKTGDPNKIVYFNKKINYKQKISSKLICNNNILKEYSKKKLTYVNDYFYKNQKKVFSQNYEDGVIEYIFEKIDVYNKYFVEIGAIDGKLLSNTANLRLNHNWYGLLLEKDVNIPLNEAKKINLHQELVTSENINIIFKKYFVPKKFDLLSIDISGFEYYLWKELNYRPRVVIVNLNTGISNEYPCVICDEPIISPKFNYFGANLHAFYDLAQKKDYEFVTCIYYNAIFIDKKDFQFLNMKHITKEECLNKYTYYDEYWMNINDYDKEWIVLE